MPSNTASSTTPSSNTIANNPVSTPAKKTKAKGPRKAATPASSSPKSRATTGAVSAGETLFTDSPNPHQSHQPPFIWIDFPQQGERLTATTYAIRLGVGGAQTVEISIDGGVWQHCRLTSGYWWYDWSNIQPGRHALVARMQDAEGRWFRTPPRNCERRP